MEKLLNKRLLMLAFGILMSCVVFGQQVRVSGTVTDATDGSSLPGVNVLVKGTLVGAITGSNGEYTLMAKPGDVLVFTFIGYLPQEITLGTQTVVNVAMRTNVQALEEVVVIGYGTVRKSDATGSVKTVDLDHFNPGSVASPQEMITGKMAGVQVVNSGGQPGSSVTIRIRGGASLSATNDPLVVIDGVPVDNNAPNGMGNALSTLNPNDIETYTVLKDASATAIYGSRASNGVIIITTKKGTAKKFSVNYSGNVSLSMPIKYLEVFSADEFDALIKDKYPSSATLLGDYTTDWQDQIFRTAVSTDDNLSFSGGVENLPYRVSLGFSDQNGILDTDYLKRFTASINLNPSFLDDHLKFDINAKGMHNDTRFGNQGAIGGALTMDPTQQVYDGTTDYTGGFFFWRNTADGTPLFTAPMNPVAQLLQRKDVADVNRFIGNGLVEYKVHFLPDLKLKANFGIDRSRSDGEITIPVKSPLSYSTYTGLGELNTYSQDKVNKLMDLYFEYDKNINDKTRLTVVGGHSYQSFHSWGKSIDATADGVTLKSSTHFNTEYVLISFFGRLNFVYNDKYILTATLRDDMTSRFSPENRAGLFPSAAFGWTISKEPFMEFASGVLSNLKLRLGYGVTGQQDISRGDYPYQANYTSNVTGAYYQMGNVYVPTLRPEGYDKDIKWEQTATYNVGLDFGFLNDRITGEIEGYYKYTSDLINEIPVPAGTNLKNYIWTNVGDMENMGVEFAVNGKVLATSDMSWELGFNATYNENKIKKLIKVADPDYDGVLTGGIAGGVGNNIQINSEGFPRQSFYVMEQVYDNDGMPIEDLYVDRNGDGSVTSDDKYRYKSPDPVVFMGFSSIFRYKDFDFNFNGRINLGNYIYNNVASNYGSYANMATSVYLSNRLKSIEKTQFENPQYFSDFYIENGSFLKLDNVSLGYTFNNLFNKVNVRASLTAQNLFTITKYTGLDPEVYGGIDNNIYPRPRIFMFGLSVTL